MKIIERKIIVLVVPDTFFIYQEESSAHRDETYKSDYFTYRQSAARISYFQGDVESFLTYLTTI